MKISDIKPYEKNAKKHPEKQVKQIANSIREFGFNQPIVVDKNNIIIVGHGRYEAAKLLGLDDVPVVVVDLTEEKAKAYRLADNKLNESDWEMNLVIEELKGLSDEMIDLTGFDKDLIIDLHEDEFDAQGEYDKIIEAKTNIGDMFQLGDHRILCGDSTVETDYARLMGGVKADMIFTDPPYGVAYQSGAARGGKKTYDKIANDELTGKKLIEFLSKVLFLSYQNTSDSACFYIWHATSTQPEFREAIQIALFEVHQTIIWVKNHFSLTRADFQHAFEPCYYGWKKGMVHYTNETLRSFDDIIKLDVQSFEEMINVWYERKDKMSEYRHPTQKPIRLAERALKKSSKLGDIILEPFCGSGSTLMACEQLGRKCYAIELDPKYVDLVIKRYELSTGKSAVKI